MLKYYGHKCFEGLLYKCVKIYLCKSYISGLNGYVFLNVFAVEAYVASWIEIRMRLSVQKSLKVEAYVASWIEILKARLKPLESKVEAYVASWIEIIHSRNFFPVLITSRLT